MSGDHRGGDHGFTLIEVMLTVVLLSVVMGALATAAIVFLRNINETQARLYVANSRSLTSRYLVGDIQSAAVYDPAFTPTPWTGGSDGTVVWPGAPATPAAPSTDPVTATNGVVECDATPRTVLTAYHYDIFPGDDPDVASKDRAVKVEYTVVAPPPGDDCQLVRTKWAVTDAGGTYDWAALEQNAVAHELRVDGTTPMVTTTDQGGGRWQVHVNLQPKSSEGVEYAYDLWAKRRVDTIVP